MEVHFYEHYLTQSSDDGALTWLVNETARRRVVDASLICAFQADRILKTYFAEDVPLALYTIHPSQLPGNSANSTHRTAWLLAPIYILLARAEVGNSGTRMKYIQVTQPLLTILGRLATRHSGGSYSECIVKILQQTYALTKHDAANLR